MKRIICSTVSLVLAGTIMSGCGIPGLDSSQTDVNSMTDSYSTDVNIVKEKEYKWVVEPSVTADNIITFDGSQVNSEDEENSDYANLSVIRLNGKYGLIDFSGKVVVEPEYEDFYTCWCGEITLFNTIDEKNGVYEYCSVDNSNQVVNYAPKHIDNSPEYFWDTTTKKVYVKNKTEETAVIFDSKKTVAVMECDAVEDAGNGRFRITEKKEPLYALAKKGRLITEMEYTDCYAPAYKGTGLTGIAMKNSDDKWGYLSSTGKTIIDFKCDGDASAYGGHLIDNQDGEHPFLFSDEYVPVVIDGTYSYYDMKGNCVVSQGEFEQARPLHNGKAWVKQNGLWGVIQLGDEPETSSSKSETVTTTAQQYYTNYQTETTTTATTTTTTAETTSKETSAKTEKTEVSTDNTQKNNQQNNSQTQQTTESTTEQQTTTTTAQSVQSDDNTGNNETVTQ